MQKRSIRHHRTLIVLPLIISLLGLIVSPFGMARAEGARLPDPPVDQVAVKLKSGVAINTILTRYQAGMLGEITETNLYFLRLPAGQTATQILPAMNADADLWYAEPNYYNDGTPDGAHVLFGSTHILFGSTGGLTPTPPGISDQWAWIKTGLADAQKISTGQGIIVAVLDTGLTPDHPLLSSSITAGYDFVDMNNSISDVGNGLDDDQNGSIDESVGHGTHISGIIETEAPGVQIMPIRVLNSDGVGTYWEVAAGIRYAVDHGAKVINMSMSAPRLTPSLADALSYAEAHGVIVVAAAGVGPGPNYPAGYPDKVGVIGVGATDQNDAIAYFSGGLVNDTDIYAPGVHIYSAYAYDGYAYGSGTSMAAPIVAAEAALLLSRHPDWSFSEITQRLLSKTSPVVGSSVGRIDLAGALSTGWEIDHSNPDLNASPSDAYITPRLRVFNNSPQDIPLSQLTMRYWFTNDAVRPQTFWCDYVTLIPCSALTGTFITIPATSPNKTALSDTYLEVGFLPSAGNLPGGGEIDTYLRIFKTDITPFNELNDYSYENPASPDRTRWSRITLYQNGVLVWGVEPAGGGATPLPTTAATRTSTPAGVTSTATRTSVPASATATRTSTPAVPTATRTSLPATATVTRTSTLPAPTATRTSTSAPAATATSVQAATKTSTPASAATCTVGYVNTNDWGGGYSATVTITNTGSTAVNGWTLVWTFPGNQTITSLWNGSYTQSGPVVTVTNADYNGTLNPNGGTASFGFNANYSGPNNKPTTFQLNGKTCQ